MQSQTWAKRSYETTFANLTSPPKYSKWSSSILTKSLTTKKLIRKHIHVCKMSANDLENIHCVKTSDLLKKQFYNLNILQTSSKCLFDIWMEVAETYWRWVKNKTMRKCRHQTDFPQMYVCYQGPVWLCFIYAVLKKHEISRSSG